MTAPPPVLTPLEARVVAVLVEKEHTVPDAYPLTLNALVTGCNQKTSRDPVMSVSEADVLDAIDHLRRRSMVIESSGNRVMRYAQNLKRVLGVPSESVALLVTLMLRGPQTSSELRANCERLQRFSDVSAVEGFLDELAGRSAGALVVRLARQPGARESRWMHLLCGPVAHVAAAPSPVAGAFPHAGYTPAAGADDAPAHGPAHAAELDGALRARVARLEAELETLKATVAKLCAELGTG